MGGSTFGGAFRVTTFGESHGPAIGAVVDGCPAGLPLDQAVIQRDLDRRRPGRSSQTTQRQEADRVEILSGLFEGKTTGTPIALLIRNTDVRSRDYESIKDLFRPGHADYTYHQKYGIRDYRGGGRASARETAVRVAAGAVARELLKREGIDVYAYLLQVGNVRAKRVERAAIDGNPFFAPDPDVVPEMEKLIEDVRSSRDSIGALVEVVAEGVPPSLGEPVFDKLSADICKGLGSIPAVKGVEIGEGFGVVTRRGSEHLDAITPTGFATNRAGGVLGGISNGAPIVARLALKPTSSIGIPQQTIDVRGEPATIVTKGRHDPCVGIRAVPIAEAMMLLVLADHWLRNKGSRV